MKALITGLLFIFIGGINAMGTEKIINVAPFCDISSDPYIDSSLNMLVDGISDFAKINRNYGLTPIVPSRTFQTDMRLNVSVMFSFPKSYKITRIAFFVSPKSFEGIVEGTGKQYAVYLKINGKYQKVTVLDAPDKTGGFEKLFKKPILCEGVKITPMNGNKVVNFGLNEVEIFAAVNEKDLKNYKSAKNYDMQSVKLLQKEPLTDCSLTKDKLKRTLFVLGPMIYANAESFAKKIADMGINQVVLYTHHYAKLKEVENKSPRLTFPDDPECMWYIQRGIHLMKDYNKSSTHVASWPSKIVLGTKTNYLKPTCKAFHKFNIKVIGSITFPIPFDMVKVYFHSGQSDWHAISPSPCVISDNFPRKAGITLYKEMIENGIDGVVLGGDEFSCEGHRFTYISPYDPCIKKFKQKYGWKTLPVDAENTLRYRQWEIFEY